jgi:hypothetical protein
MAKNREIEILKRQIAAATDLKPVDLEYWRIRTENALRFTVGLDSPALKRFRNIEYEGPGMAFAGKDRESASESALRDGLKKAIVCLEFAIDELELWDELSAPEDG